MLAVQSTVKDFILNIEISIIVTPKNKPKNPKNDDNITKNNLKYILIGKSALNVFINNSIKNHYHTVSIAMTQGDIDRLCDIVENKQNIRFDHIII